MARQSIQAGASPTVVIRADGEVQVQGWESDRLEATTESRLGLQVRQRRGTVEVRIGGDGKVWLPFGSAVTIYASKSLTIRHIHGSATLYAGGSASVHNVATLAHVSAGGMVDVSCTHVEGSDVQITAGGDLRCAITTLANTRVLVSDMGGSWEGLIGDGRVRLRLKAGGDVTLVTDAVVIAQPPHFILGRIERPA